MAAFNCFGVCLSILSCLFLTEFTFAVRRFNVIDTKFIEDACPYNDTLELFLSPTGTQSALRIKNMLTKGNSNCTVIIYSPLTGVILNLDAGPYKPGHTYEGCQDYVQLDSKNCTSTSKSLVSDGKVVFRYEKKYSDYLERSCMIISTAYRKGKCSSNEFMCTTGECIWKEFQCDGIVNCPDGSDEFGPRSMMCINISSFTLKPIDFDWNFVFPTTKSVVEYRKSFNVTITAAVACAFLIFFFGVVRFVCHYHCAKRHTRRRHHHHHHATLTTFSVIRQRPDYRQRNECPPPPSYVSLVNQNNLNNLANMNPPAYSTVVGAREDDSTSEESKGLKDNAVPGPPPPYVP
ncbi:uncharacterized protein NPIL_629891 [Nephila pilipes]|uniref:Uncharacterized protein n=1 Tax=Nephila pilipes TaxID=299642 RepID=A0A8X6UQR9_NEPPI|nr:uncharacterized protein NPIL_629891 [Nephila pilipes]